jgi:hypothetical protein
MSEITKAIRKTKNNIFAIEADVPAIPPKPSTPATIATTKNVNAQLNMIPSTIIYCLAMMHQQTTDLYDISHDTM